ncbi:MAG: hypothetical protein F6K00_25055 [Leptolyngbya sp. SIOISBB]|nr:hypothetical protein [Leptolyngbya sp. SIOISBB]
MANVLTSDEVQAILQACRAEGKVADYVAGHNIFGSCPHNSGAVLAQS